MSIRDANAPPLEIERKFLVRHDAFRSLADPPNGTLYRQGYLCADRERTVRVRIAGERGFLTIKGQTQGCTRSEYEYEIPVQDASQLLESLCLKPLIEKMRYRVAAQPNGLTWEVDVFQGANRGLTVAEIELPSEDTLFERPEWLGEEVSSDPRYFNSNLQRLPFSAWQRHS